MKHNPFGWVPRLPPPNGNLTAAWVFGAIPLLMVIGAVVQALRFDNYGALYLLPVAFLLSWPALLYLRAYFDEEDTPKR